MSICEQNDDTYLSSLISCVECLFEYYPLHDDSCHYAMVEMMKSVAMKKVNVENANRFIAFFETLPGYYEKMDYLRISKLKSIINHTLANEKPQDNEIFDNPEVKNKLILLNYLLDMEDLYYEGIAYDEIKPYKDNLFFVRQDDKWAVLKDQEIYIDFVDPDEKLTPEFIKDHLPRYFTPEDITNAVKEYMDFSYEDKVDYVLKSLLLDKKKELRKYRDTLSISEYVALFDTFESQGDLEEAGLWGKEVDVKMCEIMSRYEEILKDANTGYIGWEYPVTASTFEMSMELPVVFEKVDGSSVSLGVPLESLELHR